MGVLITSNFHFRALHDSVISLYLCLSLFAKSTSFNMQILKAAFSLLYAQMNILTIPLLKSLTTQSTVQLYWRLLRERFPVHSTNQGKRNVKSDLYSLLENWGGNKQPILTSCFLKYQMYLKLSDIPENCLSFMVSHSLRFVSRCHFFLSETMLILYWIVLFGTKR